MEQGRVGERYILGGTNATIFEILTTLSEITGLRGPGFESPPSMLVLGGALAEIYARFSSVAPPLTYKFARDYAGAFVWVSSRKAETELGYAHRPLRATLARAVRFFLEHRMVPKEQVAKLRFDLRAFV
jgi:dihydroflavonol-4-reductase